VEQVPEIESIKRLGVMGGSFDPPHEAHRIIAKAFLDSGYIDHLLVLPAPNPPHKPDSVQATFSDRLQMCKLNFSDISNLSVSDLENRRQGPSYTLLTLKTLLRADREIFLCIGQDSLEQFCNWYKWEEIIKLVQLLVYPRTKEQVLIPQPLERYNNRIVRVEGELFRHSSTEIREKQAEHLLTSKVREYVARHHLYQ
jgi:nicotinate-nucleotide adenylyltransferase